MYGYIVLLLFVQVTPQPPFPRYQQEPARGEQPLQASATVTNITSDSGTAGTGEFFHEQNVASSQQQQPLRARAPDGPPRGEPQHQPTGPPAKPLAPCDASSKMLPLRSGREDKCGGVQSRER